MASAVSVSLIAKSSSTTAIGISSSSVLPLIPTQSVLSNPETGSTGKGWIAGAVVGPIVGVTLGAVLVWMLLRKQQRSKDWRTDTTLFGFGDYPTDPFDGDRGGKATHTTVLPPASRQISEMAGDWQHRPGYQGQYPAEVAASTPDHTAAELWHGNYRSST